MTKAFLAIVLMISACAISPDQSDDMDDMGEPQAMSAAGTWDMKFAWGAGTCRQTLDVPATMVIAHDGSGYVIQDASPTTQISGTIMCSTTMCHASFVEVGPGRGDTTLSATVSADLYASNTGAITGSGGLVIQFRTGETCTQQFSATGTFRPSTTQVAFDDLDEVLVVETLLGPAPTDQ